MVVGGVLCEFLHCKVLYKKVYICIWLLLLLLSFAARQFFFLISRHQKMNKNENQTIQEVRNLGNERR